MILRYHNKQKGSRGYTLIELSISLMILGLFIAAGAGAATVWYKKKQYDTSEANVELMGLAISAFRSTEGRYPCPAPINVQRTDPDYGFEDCDGDGVGVIVVNSNRGGYDVDGENGITAGPESADIPDEILKVHIGMVPFREMNFIEDRAYDGYGGRILYAVTSVMINDRLHSVTGKRLYPFNPQAGGVSVIDDVGDSLIQPPDSADFVILSFGEDRGGGDIVLWYRD